jgi:hypothetical protein
MRIIAIAVVVVLLLTAGSVVVLAQQGPSGGPGTGMQEGMKKEYTPEQFPEVKARVLKMLDERKARLERERACVEKATTHAELKKCRPEPPMGGQMHRGGTGQQRPQMPGGQGGQ